MNRTRVARVVGLSAALLLIATVVSAQGIRPGSLLVYYGYPTSINLLFSVPAAATEFGRYDHVVWGDGLDAASHPDHANAVAILAHAATSATSIYGYVDLGVSTQNLTLAEIEARIARWDAMGVDGVLLDDFGYDFGTTRARQNAAVEYAHARGLAVIANAFRSADAFGSESDPAHNPLGAATNLGPADYFLYESHGVRLGEFEDGAAWQDRAVVVEGYRQALGFRVLSITTTATDDPGAYDASRFFYAWHMALLGGHAATGWGEFGFSAYGNSNARAPFRARPALQPGSTFGGPIVHAGSVHTRVTDLGRLDVDVAAHTYAWVPASLGVVERPGLSATGISLAPNPTREGTRIACTLERAGSVSVTLYDAGGRRVATLARGAYEAGRHEWSWPGLDQGGRAVAAGCYFVALDAGGRRDVARLVVMP